LVKPSRKVPIAKHSRRFKVLSRTIFEEGYEIYVVYNDAETIPFGQWSEDDADQISFISIVVDGKEMLISRKWHEYINQPLDWDTANTSCSRLVEMVGDVTVNGHLATMDEMFYIASHIDFINEVLDLIGSDCIDMEATADVPDVDDLGHCWWTSSIENDEAKCVYGQTAYVMPKQTKMNVLPLFN